MKLILSVLLIFEISLAMAKDPAWIQDTSKGCKGSDICAVGTGDSKSAAERNARVALSKIFNTKINSKFDSSLKASGSDLEEKISEEVTEATESAIAGVQVQKRYEDKTTHYALASLNKAKTAAGFKKEIDQIDAQLKAIQKNGEKLQKIKMEPLYIKREVLNKQYEFLTSQSLPSPVSYEEVFNAKNKASKEVVVHVTLSEEKPGVIQGLLQQHMGGLGYKVSSGKKINSNATHIVKGGLSTSKQYMNVDGFEKHKFNLNLRAMRSDSKVETGHLNFETTETGRSYSQAYEKASEKIQSFLQSNISKLNIE